MSSTASPACQGASACWWSAGVIAHERFEVSDDPRADALPLSTQGEEVGAFLPKDVHRVWVKPSRFEGPPGALSHRGLLEAESDNGIAENPCLVGLTFPGFGDVRQRPPTFLLPIEPHRASA